MISLRKKQNGVTLISLVMTIGFFVLLALFTMKLVPLYIENMSVSSVLSGLAEHDTVKKSASRNDILKIIQTRLGFNNVESVLKEDIQIIKEERQGLVIVSIEYEVRTSFVGNIDLALFFSESVEISVN